MKESLVLKKSEAWKDRRLQAIKEYRRCKEDKQYFIENYCYFFDPRPASIKRNGTSIFRPIDTPYGGLFPNQIKLLRELEKYEPLFVEKSRDEGVSWTAMGFELHQVLFPEGLAFLNISRKESEVEDAGKTVISLFGRLDFMHKRLPPFLRLRMDNPFLSFRVPATNGLIKGESANPNAGRDFQYTMIFVDEAAFIDCLPQMWKSINNSTNCIVMVSTATSDQDNKYYEVREMIKQSEKEGSTPEMKRLRLSWKDHPYKDAAWYAKKKTMLSDEDIATEIDISFERSTTLKIYPEFNKAFHVSDYHIPLNPKAPLYLSFDFGLDDPEAVLFMQIGYEGDVKCLYVLDEYERGGLLTNEHFVNIQKKLVLDLKYPGKKSELICRGDPAGKKKERTSGRSVIKEYEALGIIIDVINADPGYDVRRRCVKTLLKGKTKEGRSRLRINPKCTGLIWSLTNHARKKQGEDAPRKDKTVHKAQALEFFCVKEFPLMEPAAVVVGMDPETIRDKQLEAEGKLGRNKIDTNMFGRQRNYIFRKIG